MFQLYTNEVPLAASVVASHSTPLSTGIVKVVASEYPVSFTVTDALAPPVVLVEVPLTLPVASAFRVAIDSYAVECGFLHTTQDISVGDTVNLSAARGRSLFPCQSTLVLDSGNLCSAQGTFTGKAYVVGDVGIPTGMKHYFYIVPMEGSLMHGYIRPNVKELKSFQPLK